MDLSETTFSDLKYNTMIEIVFATHNLKKSKELKEILYINGYKVLDLNDIGLNDEIEESGKTLEENALIKANYLFHKTKKPSFGEDSGLEVEALDHAPGVYSARYAGPEKNDFANITKLLKNLTNIKNRAARFRTVIAYVDEQQHQLFDGIVTGTIIQSCRGEHGFGYDPVFIPDGYEITFAQMDASEKNKISHRARALDKMVQYLNPKHISHEKKGKNDAGHAVKSKKS